MNIIAESSQNITNQLHVDSQKHEAVQKKLKEDLSHKEKELDEMRNKKKAL